MTITENDPWADAPEDAEVVEEAYEEPEEPKAPRSVVTRPKTRVAKPVDDDGENGDLAVSVTWKAGTGFNAPWLVGRWKSIAAAHEELSKAETKTQLDELFGIVTKAAARFEKHANDNALKEVGAAQPQQARSNVPAAAQQAPGGQKKYCAHGEMSYKTGQKKDGSLWKGFFCPTPKGTEGQCSPEFLRG